MEKRLKEIVIYILEHSGSLAPEQRAQLEDLREKLSMSGFPVDEIEDAIRRALESVSEPGGTRGIDQLFDTEVRELELATDAAGYLQRLSDLGLINEDQEDEILSRAARLHPDSVSLEQIQFLAASLIFDENLGVIQGGDGSGEGLETRRHH